MDTSRLLALLQLSSPALPIGGFSYSQGFEAAVEHNIINDEASAGLWIADQLQRVIAPCEAPIWLLLFDAWSGGDFTRAAYWNEWFLASRETREMRLETEQMGWSLGKLAADLNWGGETARLHLGKQETVAFPTAHAFCMQAFGMEPRAGLAAYLFSWLENQAMAAIKTVPLGQVAGQRILQQSRQLIPAVLQQALIHAGSTPPRLFSMAPQWAILSSRHETQYSRIFRS